MKKTYLSLWCQDASRLLKVVASDFLTTQSMIQLEPSSVSSWHRNRTFSERVVDGVGLSFFTMLFCARLVTFLRRYNTCKDRYARQEGNRAAGSALAQLIETGIVSLWFYFVFTLQQLQKLMQQHRQMQGMTVWRLRWYPQNPLLVLEATNEPGCWSHKDIWCNAVGQVKRFFDSGN